MHIVRLKETPFIGDEVQVPIPPEALEGIKDVADHNRKRVIPLISEI
jgi:hypothetical protein